MERDPTIVLDASIQRCWASKPCPDVLICARRLATIPKGNAILDDYSHALVAGERCTRFIPISRKYVPPVQPRVVKDWPQGVE